MADNKIVSGKKYHLSWPDYQNRGTAAEVYAREDWIRLSKQDGNRGDGVLFIECPDGRYKIQNTWSNWQDYPYWALGKTGVYLTKWEKATAWDVHLTGTRVGGGDGIVIGTGDYLLRAPDDWEWVEGAGGGMLDIVTEIAGLLTGADSKKALAYNVAKFFKDKAVEGYGDGDSSHQELRLRLSPA